MISLGKPNKTVIDFYEKIYKTFIYLNDSSKPTAKALIEGELTFAKLKAACPSLTNDNLTKVEIGNKVTSIGEYTFFSVIV